MAGRMGGQAMTTNEPFVLSIEDYEGHCFQHGFHLGTQEPLARQMAEEIYQGRVSMGLPVVTVALKRQGKLHDVFMGDRWNND